MHKDIKPGAQARAQACTRIHPEPLKARIRHRDINNRQVQPIDVPRPELGPKARHAKRLQLMHLRKRNHRDRAPSGNRIEIDIQLSVPRPPSPHPAGSCPGRR